MNSDHTSLLPDEVLSQVFIYLKVEDRKSCRLVCKRWNTCCRDNMVSKSEKFVFQDPIVSTAEINEFLTNLERRRINIELIDITLSKLNFEVFGEKIERLEIRNCFLEEEIVLKKIFLSSPNMKCLHLNLDEESEYSGSSSTVSRSVIEQLREETFRNECLEEFHYRGYESNDKFRRLNEIFLSHLNCVFPRLKCISISGDKSGHNVFRMNAQLMSFFRESDTTRFLSPCNVYFDDLRQSEIFTSLSRLETVKLFLGVDLTRKWAFFNLSAKFFSQMTALRDLSLKIGFRRPDAAHNPQATRDDEEDATKTILFQVLMNCSKLKSLVFQSWVKSSIRLSGDELEELYSSVCGIRKLSLPAIYGEPKTQTEVNHIAELVIDNEEFYGPSDWRLILLSTCTSHLTSLSIVIQGEAVSNVDHSASITKILRTQESLRSLTIQVEDAEEELPRANLREETSWKHNKLEHLKIEFNTSRKSGSYDCVMVWFLTWGFPNLQIFELSARPKFLIECPELKQHFKNWLGGMLSLFEITVESSFMDFKDCQNICEPMRSLRRIDWTFSSDKYPERENIENLFVNFPYLYSLRLRKSTGLWSESEYKYRRSNKQLFQKSNRRTLVTGEPSLYELFR